MKPGGCLARSGPDGRWKGWVSVANASVPRWHGDNYQSRFFWLHAAALLDPQRTDVVEVTFEAAEPKAFDDVVVRYDPGRPSSGPYRIVVDYHQVKWHVDHSRHFGYEHLIDPEFVGGQSVSILQRLAQAKANANVPREAAFTLVTTDQITQGDVLGELVSRNDGRLRLHKLFDGTTDRSRMGKVRKLWREHMGFEDDAQLEELLADFFIKPNSDSLEDLRGRVSEKFRLVGLLGDETSSTFRYDQAARDLLDRSINGLTRDAFDKLCREEKWLAPVTADQPVRMNVALRSFTRGVTAADLLEAAPENTLSLVGRFNQRHLREGVTWDDLRDEAAAFLDGVLERGRVLRLFLDAHGSLAFLAGATLGFKSGADVEVMQKSRPVSLVWHAGDGRDGPVPVIEVDEVGDGADVAVSVAITRDTVADVRSYVAGNLPSVGRLLRVVAEGGPGPGSVAGGAHAARIADAVADAVAKARSAGGTTHLFVAAPNAFSFLLGQHADSMGACVPYEFDFGGRVDGLYRPTFTI